MKQLVLCAALLLGGCASADRPQINVMRHAKPVPVIIHAPIVTPNDQVKHRWYDRFKKHPKFFH